jgi:hypothetical protein
MARIARTVEIDYLRPPIIARSVAAMFGRTIRPIRVLKIVPRTESRA